MLEVRERAGTDLRSQLFCISAGVWRHVEDRADFFASTDDLAHIHAKPTKVQNSNVSSGLATSWPLRNVLA
jgi:hypothetical protein